MASSSTSSVVQIPALLNRFLTRNKGLYSLPPNISSPYQATPSSPLRWSFSSLPHPNTSDPTPSGISRDEQKSTLSITGNPFLPRISQRTGYTIAPAYSIRRQKMLVRACLESIPPVDPSVLLPPSPTIQELLSRTTNLQRVTYRRPLTPATYIPITSNLVGSAWEMKGPYSGRKGHPFKGRAWEKKVKAKEARLAEVESKLSHIRQGKEKRRTLEVRLKKSTGLLRRATKMGGMKKAKLPF